MGDIAQTDDRARDAPPGGHHPDADRAHRSSETALEVVRNHPRLSVGPTTSAIASGCLWSGAEYRGRGRDTNWWKGRARFGGATHPPRCEKINILEPGAHCWRCNRRTACAVGRHHHRQLTAASTFGSNLSMPAGRLGPRRATSARMEACRLAEIGLEDRGDGSRRAGTAGSGSFRLPEDNSHAARLRRKSWTVALGKSVGDNPIWVSVFTEDGFQAWSSPIFVFR